MIIGFDHVALTATDLYAFKSILEADSYECLFLEDDLTNNWQKARLLRHYQPLHGIAYFKSRKLDRPAIEVVNHGAEEKDVLGPFSVDGSRLTLRVADIGTEREFWNKVLRFKTIDDSEMVLSSPVPGWSVSIKFIKDNEVQNSMLDSSGYTCVAFYTNNIIEDTEKARASGGMDIVEPFTFLVNGKTLKISIFRTPDGALCEFIQPEV